MSARFRFRSLGLAALAAVTALGLVSESTGAGLIAHTEAAYTDSEFARANVAAKWPLAFASVIAGSAKSSRDTVVAGTGNMTYDSLYRWTQEVTGSPVTPTSETTTPRLAYSRTWDQRYRGTGVSVSDSTPNLLGAKDPQSNALHSWSAVRTFQDPGTRTEPQNYRCMVINESFGPAANDQRCALGNNLVAARNDTAAFGFSVDVRDTYLSFLNAADIKTAVRCGLNSAEADAPTGRVDVGREAGATNPHLNYSGVGTIPTSHRTIWANGIAPGPNGFSLASGQISPIFKIGVYDTEIHARVMPIISQTSQTSPPYAISEVAAYVEYFDNDSLSSMGAKMYYVLSRAECGVKRISDTALPPKRPALPASLPGGNGLTTYTGSGFNAAAAPAQPMAMRAAAPTTTITSLPPATTVTSPLESATATVTTTSAPPDPSGTKTTAPTAGPTSTVTTQVATTTTAAAATSTPPPTQTVTTTSATPAPSIPSAPGDLSPTAATGTAGTVKVDGVVTDVVVRGDAVPADAPTATSALDTWINDGTRPSGDWATYTSTNPSSDGWRWAAINQVTGTVVYVR